MTRWQPPHPARTIRPRHDCPTGRPRFATLAFARAALLPAGVPVVGLTAAACDQCEGAHLWPAPTTN